MIRQNTIHVLTISMLTLMFLPILIPIYLTETTITDSRRVLYTMILRFPAFLMIIITSLSGSPEEKATRGWKKPGRTDLAICIGLTFLTLFTGSFVYSDHSLILPESQDPGFLLIFLMILYGLMSAVMEETFFRSWILVKYGQGGNPTIPVIIISSLLFGIIHTWQGWMTVVYSILAGIIYSVVFIRRRNLPLLIISHAFHNTLAILLMFIR